MTNELDSMCGISDEEMTERFKEAIRIDNEERRIKGEPVAKYDNENRKDDYFCQESCACREDTGSI